MKLAVVSALTLVFLSTVAGAKVPNSPLYPFQFWAKSHDQILSLNNPTNKYKPVSIKTCSGSDMNLEEAWDVSVGSRKIIVAVLDSGFRDQHINYRDNIWVNARQPLN